MRLCFLSFRLAVLTTISFSLNQSQLDSGYDVRDGVMYLSKYIFEIVPDDAFLRFQNMTVRELCEMIER